MSFVRRIISRLNVRMALVFTALFAVGMTILFAIVSFSVWSTLRDREDSELRNRLLSLWARVGAEGLSGFMRGSNSLIEGPYLVRVTDSSARNLFVAYPGSWNAFPWRDLGNFPAELEGPVRLVGEDGRNWNLMFATAGLPSGYYLQVGLSTEQRTTLMEILVQSWVLGFVAVVLLGFVLGSLAASRFLKPLRSLTSIVQSLLATGDLAARIPASGGRGELADLATQFNTLMGRVQSVIERMQGSLDSLAHDLRTPLTRIRGAAEIALAARERPGFAQEAAEALAGTVEETERLQRMVATVLDIAGTQSGVLQPRMATVNLAELCAETADFYGYHASHKDVTVTASGPDPCRVMADPARLAQALGNLTDNAVKFSPAGGRVELVWEQTAAGTTLSVLDQGSGIGDDELPYIWERLYKGGQARPEQAGMGLGLSLVRAVVLAHGGKVAAQRRVEGGMQFSIHLPPNLTIL